MFSTPLKPITVALATGLFWAISVLWLGVLAVGFNYGTAWVAMPGTVYLGFEPTWGSLALGTIWGFADGFIGGLFFAWIYNFVARATHATAG